MSRPFDGKSAHDHMYGLCDYVVLRSTFDLEGRGQTGLTTMMKGFATVGGPKFPQQTAINIDELGWWRLVDRPLGR